MFAPDSLHAKPPHGATGRVQERGGAAGGGGGQVEAHLLGTKGGGARRAGRGAPQIRVWLYNPDFIVPSPSGGFMKMY